MFIHPSIIIKTVSADPGSGMKKCSLCLKHKNINIIEEGVDRVQVLPCGDSYHKGCINRIKIRDGIKYCPEPVCVKPFRPESPISLFYGSGNDKSYFVNKYHKYKQKYLQLKNKF